MILLIASQKTHFPVNDNDNFSAKDFFSFLPPEHAANVKYFIKFILTILKQVQLLQWSISIYSLV